MWRCEQHPEHDDDDTPPWVSHILQHLTDLEILMSEFASDAEHLSADVQALTDGLAPIEAEIAALKAQPAAAALDFTALDAQVARVKGDAPAAAPAPPAPAADPAPGTPAAPSPGPAPVNPAEAL